VKVKELATSPDSAVRDFPRVRRGGAADLRQPFGRQMDTAAAELYEEHVGELAAQIEEQGRRLAQRADVGELERYRRLIAELLNEVVSNAYAFRKEKSIDAKGRIRVCATISKINGKLDELAEKILDGTRDKLEIISRVDDIRGLIVDILF